MIAELFYIAYRNIRHRLRRSLLTIVGVVVGITAVVALISLGLGLQSSVESQFQEIGSDKVFLRPGPGGEITSDDLEAARSARGVGEVAGLNALSTRGEAAGENSLVTVIGLPEGGKARELVLESYTLELSSGTHPSPSSAALGHEVLKNRFGEELSLRQSIEINGTELRITGTYRETGDPFIDGSVYISSKEFSEVFGTKDSYSQAVIRVQDGFTPAEVKNNVKRRIKDSREVEEADFSVSTQEDIVDSFNSILSVVSAVVIGIASISLVVGSVNIMNTMYTSVNRRTREIGVMKSIGASRQQIMLLFLIESGIIGAVGGLIGLLLGSGVSMISAEFASRTTSIPITPFLGAELAAGAVLFSFTVGVIAGVLPSRAAANLPPAQALRHE
ncbi:MAG: ABC transporter permease [Candidatus Nanohaloarchaea archaeon]